MAMNADLVANALTQHDKVRRSTDIPLFYGRKDKDSISPHQLIERLERAARVARWDTDLRKCDEFFLCLRDKAISWANTLDNIRGFNKENWQDVKKEFLDAYAPKFTAKTLCTSFQDLRQKSGESVQDFYNHVSDVFRDAYHTKPAHVMTFAGTAAERFDLTLDQANALVLYGIENMQTLTMNTVFLGGLREELRIKVLESGPTEIRESVRLAREIEVIMQDKQSATTKGSVISPIRAEEDNNDEGEMFEDEESELMVKINAVRRHTGRPPLTPGAGFPSGSRGPAPQCRFCRNVGHMQRECRKRIAKGAPMVDAQGQPFKSMGAGNNVNKVSSVQQWGHHNEKY